MERKTKKVFGLIFVTLLFDLLAFALILPLLPKILDYYAMTDTSGTYKHYHSIASKFQNSLNVPESHNQVLLAGLLGSWFSLLQFVSSPFVGFLSDKFGRRPILILASIGTFFSYLIWYNSSRNFALFVFSRTVGGLCKSNVGLSLAVISDVSSERNRGKGMALVGSAFSLAFIIGPMFGAYLATTVTRGASLNTDQLIMYPATLAMLLSLISFSLVFLLLEETYNHQTTNTVTQNESEKIKHNLKISSSKEILHFINPKSLLNFALIEDKQIRSKQKHVLKSSGSICFLYLLFFSGLEFTLSFLTHLKFGFKPVDQGYLYLFSGTLMALIQGGYVRKATGSLNASRILIVGLGIIVPSFIMMGLATKIWMLYSALALFAVSSSIAIPCLTTIASLNTPPSYRGLTMGTFRSIGSLARALGPCCASIVFFSFGPSFCYVFGAFLLIYPLIKMIRLNRFLKLQETETNPVEINNNCINQGREKIH